MTEPQPWPNGTVIKYAIFINGSLDCSEPDTEATIRGYTHWGGHLWYVLQGGEPTPDLLFIRPADACVMGAENNVDNREILANLMWDRSFEEDQKYAYMEFHMDSLAQLNEQEFNAHWQEVIS